MSSQLLSPYRSLVNEVHHRMQRLYRCALWMLERGHADTARELLAMLLKEFEFHHGVEERRLHPVLSRLHPSRSALVARLELDHRHLEEELERLVKLLDMGAEVPLVQKRAERLHQFLVDHLSMEQQQAFLPLETLVVMNADAVAPGT
jgi:CO dehydrogenase/acetyl-CoA synthase alpha subunit